MAASDNDLVVRIGGDSAAGGIVTTGEVFARIASFVGLEIYTTRTIPAEIKGGHVMFQVRVADHPVHSRATSWTCSSRMTRNRSTATTSCSSRTAFLSITAMT